jgi:GTPase SAR1 family protein
LVFALDDSTSFLGDSSNNKQSLEGLFKQLVSASKNTAPILLVGNKLDASKRQLPADNGPNLIKKIKEWATESDIPGYSSSRVIIYQETSAKTGEGVDEMFKKLAQLSLEGKVPTALRSSWTAEGEPDTGGKKKKCIIL